MRTKHEVLRRPLWAHMLLCLSPLLALGLHQLPSLQVALPLPTPVKASRPSLQLSPPDSLGLTYLTSICCWGQGGESGKDTKSIFKCAPGYTLLLCYGSPAQHGISLSLQACGRATSTSLFSPNSAEPTALNGVCLEEGTQPSSFLGVKKVLLHRTTKTNCSPAIEGVCFTTCVIRGHFGFTGSQ